jgi:putative sugar O-methyltransferase
MNQSLKTRISRLAQLHDRRVALPKDLPLDSKWEELLLSEPGKLFTADGAVNFNNLANFRRLKIFVSDMSPSTDFATFAPAQWLRTFARKPVAGTFDFLKEWILGAHRGQRQLLREIYDILDRDGATDLLRKYPAQGSPGNPYTFAYRGCSYNLRWVRHIYFNNLIRKHLAGDIRASKRRFINIDVGSSYGLFASLFKSEFPNTVQVLADFPDQLLLAYYYLGSLFPDARIATLVDFADRSSLTHEYLEQFDFVLLPVPLFSMLERGSADMVTNFFSFGEMRRDWFRGYLDSAAFQGAKYFFTCNRFESAPRMCPTYDSDLTILDYPLAQFDKIFFGIFPLYPYYVTRRALISYDKNAYSSQYFDFIGKRI